ncbi:unnamed protein product [Polarella glacialis]|uniref:Uncharacterized protein n=1 Tax=Polarella glacialis TaxID=89957 RepID=A0A813HBM8_POLGL|nr:unnamed protein product [Polarella glacialis]
MKSQALLDIRQDLLFEVASFCMSSLPHLLGACSTLRRSMLDSLGKARSLAMGDADVSFGFAEILAVWGSQLETLVIEGRAFTLQDLRLQSQISFEMFSLKEAIMLAPILRCGSANRLAYRSRCLDLRKLRPLSFGGQIRLDSGFFGMNFSPEKDVEVVLVAGLLQIEDRGPEPHLWSHLWSRLWASVTGRRQVVGTIVLDTRYDSHSVKRAREVASWRCGVRFVNNGPSAGQAREPSCWPHPIFWFLAVALMLVLRTFEDSHAKETGYPGALMPHHPLKLMSFVERLHQDVLLEGPAAARSIGSSTSLLSEL